MCFEGFPNCCFKCKIVLLALFVSSSFDSINVLIWSCMCSISRCKFRKVSSFCRFVRLSLIVLSSSWSLTRWCSCCTSSSVNLSVVFSSISASFAAFSRLSYRESVAVVCRFSYRSRSSFNMLIVCCNASAFFFASWNWRCSSLSFVWYVLTFTSKACSSWCFTLFNVSIRFCAICSSFCVVSAFTRSVFVVDINSSMVL
mmetsp:Transcript_9623/g.14211  ORF Transcript_9623/g.14211 Transcript_9623/m.14211 type:complete len:200 (+) Transcript_9623:517-1116(+)